MSHAEAFAERFLTCTICTGVYDDPATLQCGHTYCRKCLTNLIVKSKPRAIRDKVIPCVLKCDATKVPNPLKPVNTWSSQIKPSFVITNLWEEFERMSDTDCSRCRSRDVQTPAVKWCPMCRQSLCEGCIASHRRDPTTMRHTLTDLPSRVDGETQQETEQPKQQYTQCGDHAELLKFVCENCNNAICSTCWSLHHKQCKCVVLLETKVDQMQTYLEDHKSKLEHKLETSLLNIAGFKLNSDELERIKLETQCQARKEFQKLYDLINSKESNLLQTFDAEIDSVTLYTTERIQSERNYQQKHQQNVHFIERAMKSGSMVDMYNMYQSCLPPETDIKQSTYRSVTDVKFTVNTGQLIDNINRLNFGTFDLKYEAGQTNSDMRVTSAFPDSVMGTPLPSDVNPTTSDVVNMLDTIQDSVAHNMKVDKMIKCNLPSDLKHPIVRDITVLVSEGMETVVVTDCKNSCVKSFYTRNQQKCHSKLRLYSIPHGVTQWKDTQVMVTVPGSREVITVAVSPDLVLLSTITTRKGYHSLVVLDLSRLAGSSELSHCVDILNMDGQVIKSVSTRKNKELFSQPWYMCVNNKGNLLVSDCEKKTVTCLTSEGEVVWVYAPTGDYKLKYPTGIQWTPEGILLVDDNPPKVILLTESGQYVRHVLTEQDGLYYPQGIYVDKQNSLFVCCDSDVKYFQCTGLKQKVVK